MNLSFRFFSNKSVISMKHALFVLTLAVATSIVHAQPPSVASSAPAAAPAFKAHVLNRSEVDEWLKSPDKVLFIDVRRPDEVAAIGGFAVYLSIPIQELESDLKWIPKGRRIITVSNHAARGGKAADLLKEKGFDVIGAVGVELYEKDGGTLAHFSAPKTAATDASSK
jgi:rhodanese-related sulfurtransferase